MDKQSPILITGALGFIGKNLTAHLTNQGYTNLLLFDIAYSENPQQELATFAKEAKFVFHLAGINRPQSNEAFYAGNRDSTTELLELLSKFGNKAPVLLSSSTQATLDNDYGKSKAQAEQAVYSHSSTNGSPVYVFRLPGVFGKWCRPNYNSVVATFCHNIASGLPIEVRDPAYSLPLVYIDDVVRCFTDAMEGKVAQDRSTQPVCLVNPVYQTTLGKLAELISSFRQSRTTLAVPNIADEFEKKLYSTYLSYIPSTHFSYNLKMNCDNRGSFTEFLRTPDRGQVSINISKPGVVKGNHWHHTKNEKFLVVKGEAIIRFRQIGTSMVTEYRVSDKILQVVDIPTGYTHNIENVGKEDLITVMWANEPFDPENPDTFFEMV